MQDQPWCEAELDFLRRQVPTLRRKLGLEAAPVSRDKFAEDQLLLQRSDVVELAAAQHYSDHWEQVYYVENILVNALFGLAFWDEIFLPLPGAFVNPFQSVPLDMYSADFFRRRRQPLKQRMDVLSRVDLAEELLDTYDRHLEISNRWINWRYLPRELVEQVLGHIPREHWLAIWRRILFDPEANRSGIPDLIAMDSKAGYCLIEVKGPGDQLQLNQRRWLRFFQEQGIPARVARVQWCDD